MAKNAGQEMWPKTKTKTKTKTTASRASKKNAKRLVSIRVKWAEWEVFVALAGSTTFRESASERAKQLDDLWTLAREVACYSPGLS